MVLLARARNSRASLQIPIVSSGWGSTLIQPCTCIHALLCKFACCCIRTMNVHLPIPGHKSWQLSCPSSQAGFARINWPESQNFKITEVYGQTHKSTSSELRTPNPQSSRRTADPGTVIKMFWNGGEWKNWPAIEPLMGDGWGVCVLYTCVCYYPHTQRLTKVSTIIPLCMAQFTMHSHHPELEK